MNKKISDTLLWVGTEVWESIKGGARQGIDDYILDEKITGMYKATAAMLEAGVEEKTVIDMLQKYWDLRLSEAQSIISHQQNAFIE